MALFNGSVLFNPCLHLHIKFIVPNILRLHRLPDLSCSSPIMLNFDLTYQQEGAQTVCIFTIVRVL